MSLNNLVSLHESRSPLDYPTQTHLALLILLYELHEVGLILSLGTLNLTYIDPIRIMKSSVYPIPKRGVESSAKVKQKHASIYRELKP